MISTITGILFKLTFVAAVHAAIIAATLLASTVATAATYYVATNGSDSNPGSQTQPFRTVNKGISSLKPGDTLYIRSGTYHEYINDNSLFGSAASPITVAGYPGDSRPILRTPSSMPIALPPIAIGWESTRTPRHLILRDFEIDAIDLTSNHTGGCMRVDAPNVTIDNLIMRNCPRDGIGMRSKNLIVRNSQIINCGRNQPPADTDTKGVGFYIAPDDSVLRDPASIGGDNIFENNVVDGCRAGGGVIHYHRADNNIIRNNIVRNFGTSSPLPLPAGRPDFVQYGSGFTIGGDGVMGTPGPQNNQIYNNIIHTATGNQRPSECFNLWATGSGNDVYNNTCYNVGIGIRMSAYSWNGVSFRNNIFSRVTVEQEVNLATLNGTYFNNLMDTTGGSIFVDAAAGDFRLKSGSTSLGATPNTAITAVQLPAPVVRPSSPVNLIVGR